MVVLDVGVGVCSGTETTFFTRAKDCLRFILQRKVGILLFMFLVCSVSGFMIMCLVLVNLHCLSNI